MKQKHWKILSLLMLIMAIAFSIATFMGHLDAAGTALICIGATLDTYGASKAIK